MEVTPVSKLRRFWQRNYYQEVCQFGNVLFDATLIIFSTSLISYI